MKSNRQTKEQKITWLSKVKDNVGWVLSLCTVVGVIFGVGRWSATLEYKAELNAINARHYQEIATLKEEHLKEHFKLESEKTNIQNELTILKAKLGKEDNHE